MIQIFSSDSPNKAQADAVELSHVLQAVPHKKNAFFATSFKADFDDNSERKEKIQGFLNNFQIQLQKLQDKESSLSLKDKIKENSEPLQNILDNIFCLFNINIQLIHQDQSDSALRMEPIAHIGKAIQCLIYIAVVLSKFPYSFIKIIELNKFTLCKSVQLRKQDYTDLVNLRMMNNGLFLTDVHDTFIKVENHFYRVVLHHTLKKVPSIQVEWPIELSPKANPFRDSRKLMTFSPNQTHKKSLTKEKRSISPQRRLEESKQQISLEGLKNKDCTETFHKILSNTYEGNMMIDEKFEFKKLFLMEKLRLLDPIGMCEEWWERLPKNYVTVIEKSHGEFSLKI